MKRKLNMQKQKEQLKAAAEQHGHKFRTRFFSTKYFDKPLDQWVTGHFLRCSECKAEFTLILRPDVELPLIRYQKLKCRRNNG